VKSSNPLTSITLNCQSLTLLGRSRRCGAFGLDIFNPRTQATFLIQPFGHYICESISGYDNLGAGSDYSACHLSTDCQQRGRGGDEDLGSVNLWRQGHERHPCPAIAPRTSPDLEASWIGFIVSHLAKN
jgi:hypothetical protein